MKKKIIISLVVLLMMVFAYLVIAYQMIYYRIGQGNLPYLDQKAMYKFNEQLPGKKITYVALGDSLTYGVGTTNFQQAYPYLLAKDLSGKTQGLRLILLAYPGYKTADLVRDYQDKAIIAQPDIITIMIGVNDMHNRVNLADFKTTYQGLIENLKTKTKAQIYLISLPFIGDSSLMPFPYQNYFIQETKEYNEQVKLLAKENNLVFIDITTDTEKLFKTPGNHYSRDRFHPSAEGYKIFEKLIYDRINH